MKTVAITKKDVKKNWIIFDAEGKTVGRLASDIAMVLRGKHKPIFAPHIDCGDFVVVVNASKVQFTGDKLTTKNYYNYSGYISGMRARKAQDVLRDKPEEIIRHAVKGMLPKNRLANRIITHLKVYANAEHPHAAQNPTAATPRTNK